MTHLPQIVSDTGSLISLEKLRRGYALMRRLYSAIIVPPEVLAEACQEHFQGPTAYLRYYAIQDFLAVRPVTGMQVFPELQRLHQGEKFALQLAHELGLPLLIEETIGREIAGQLGVKFSGIAGQIIKAFHQQFLSVEETREQLTELFQAGRINKKIYGTLCEAITRR